MSNCHTYLVLRTTTYRVHLPCHVPVTLPTKLSDKPGPVTVPAMIYLNPEWDFLYFKVDTSAPGNLVTNAFWHKYDGKLALAMVHDIRAYDPAGVGVQKLAVHSKLVSQWGYWSSREMRNSPIGEVFVMLQDGLGANLSVWHRNGLRGFATS